MGADEAVREYHPARLPGSQQTGLMQRLLVLLLALTLGLAAVVVWAAAAPGGNRWLGSDPMLGEFLLGVAPFLTGAAAIAVWRRGRHGR